MTKVVCRAARNPDEPNRLDIRIEYVIAGKNDKRNLVFPFYLKNEDDENGTLTAQPMIPPPKLDDRSFHDIVEEAISMIPRYSPDWTNHNPSDPGITLIELAAWMTDLLIYRLNQVPDKNYVAFLNLLGIKLRAPRAAKALVRFALVEGATKQRVPRGTQVSTPQATEEHTVTFETARDVDRVDGARPIAASRTSTRRTPRTAAFSIPAAGAAARPFEVFAGAQRDRALHLPRRSAASRTPAMTSLLSIFLGTPERGGRDLARLLEWEHWDGTRWKDLAARADRRRSRRGRVPRPVALRRRPRSTTSKALWVRGRLAEVPQSPEDTEIDTIRAQVEVVGEGLLPTQAYANLDNDAFLALDLSKNIYPFGKEPKVDCILYLACDELMQTADAYISIEMHARRLDGRSRGRTRAISSCSRGSTGMASAGAASAARRRAARCPAPATSSAFTTSTQARSRSPASSASAGRRTWRRSSSTASPRSGSASRIEKGDYGEQGTYTLENEQVGVQGRSPAQAAGAAQRSRFRYREDYRDVRHVLSFNDFQFTDCTEVARTEYTIFQPFQAKPEESPALYLGFTSKPAERSDRPLLPARRRARPRLAARPTRPRSRPPSSRSTNRRGGMAWEGGQRVVWEYWDGRDWEPLVVDDETQGFTVERLRRCSSRPMTG